MNKYVATITFSDGTFEVLENDHDPFELDFTSFKKQPIGIAFAVNGVTAGSVLFDFDIA